MLQVIIWRGIGYARNFFIIDKAGKIFFRLAIIHSPVILIYGNKNLNIDRLENSPI